MERLTGGWEARKLCTRGIRILGKPPLESLRKCVQEYGVLRRVELRRILPPVLRVGWGVLVVGAILLLGGWRGEGATVVDGRKALATGEYRKAVELAEDELEDNARDEGWHRVRVEGLLAQGKYSEADAACSNALVRVPRSVTLRWLARDAFSMNGRPRQAREAVAEIPQLVSRSPWAYREAADLVVVGRSLLAAGADPKEVLERIYAVAKKGAPDQREAPLASGELALDKGDFALAAKQFDEALKRFPDDADLHFGRARAFAESDRKVMGEALEAALKANPKHAPSWLLLADHRIDAEDYEGAKEALREVRGVNPAHPEAWAYEAVIAHLRNDQEAEDQARRKALEPWPTNPRVPHLMGKKLSQKYRFAEGAELQREALRFEAGYLPAKAQLASDLLRLGEDASGWEMVQEVHAADGYDVGQCDAFAANGWACTSSALKPGTYYLWMKGQTGGSWYPGVADRRDATPIKVAAGNVAEVTVTVT